MVDDLIFEDVICFCVFDFEAEIPFGLVDHFGFVLGNSFGKVFDDWIVVFILLGYDELISKVFVILFVFLDLLLKNDVLFLRKFQLLVFSLDLKF